MFFSKMASSSYQSKVRTNDENAFPEDLRKKGLLKEHPPTKRIALSTLNESVRQTTSFRNQKAVVKPGTNVQNVTFPLKSKEPFPIYQELDETESLSQNAIRLYKDDGESIFQEEANENDSSCMILDSSLDRSSDIFRDELFHCSVYSLSIYEHLKKLEVKFRPSPNYMRKQPDITLSMRSVLVDWLVEVTEEYKMLTETLYMAVSFTDRFLSVMSVLRCKLQLVGTASMFIASKYEEIYPPEMKEFVYITDDTYTKRQVLRMEHLILKVLAFDLSGPTAYTFLQHFSCIAKIPGKVRCLAEYLCELTLLESEPFLTFLPSEIAGASICLANYTLEQEPWCSELQEMTGYTVSELSYCIECLYKSYSKAAHYPQQAVRQKYKSSKYLYVADISPPAELDLNL